MPSMSPRRVAELPPVVAGLLSDQAGVVSGAQIVSLGISRHAVDTWRHNRLVRTLIPGVYADHTGEPTWLQRAWAAVLYAAAGADLRSAALCGASATRAHEGPGRAERDGQVIHVAVERSRNLRAQPGVRIHRVSWLDDDHVLWNLAPPRQRYEHALLDLAVERLAAARSGGHRDAIGVISRAVGGRRTTAPRVAAALADRPRATERVWLSGVLDDIGAGTCSVLEHGYHTLVATAHGLPAARLQVRALSSTGVIYRDADYGERVIELDGRLGHSESSDRDRDFERDLDAALDGKATSRLSWGQVFDRPCVTAGKVARLLAGAGWSGRPTACSPGCPAPDVFRGRAA